MNRAHAKGIAEVAVLSGLLALFMSPCFPAAGQWQPDKPVELIVGVTPGAAHDRNARFVQKILQQRKLLDTPSLVINKAGGGQVIAMTYLNQHPANAHYLYFAAHPLLTNKILGRSTLTYTDFTPVTQLFNEYLTFSVRRDSPLQNGKQFIDRLRKEPGGLSIAIGSSPANGPHLATILAAKAAGISVREIKTVVFGGGGDAALAVLGGHVDVLATTAGTAATFLQEGKTRIIAISSPVRLGGIYAQVPTWKEQGVDNVFSSFRAVLAPKGIDAAPLAYWEQTFAKLYETPEWQVELETRYWAPVTAGQKESEAFLKAEYARIQAALAEIGLAK
jgi:putative tricarboxylic transport membrane protein